MIPIRPPLAMVLGLFLPGTGHLYAGWPRRALMFAAAPPLAFVVLTVATATEALSVSLFVPLVCLVPIALQIGASIDAGRKASTPILAPHRVSNRGVVVAFALVSFAASLFTVMTLEATTLSARRMSSATMTPNLLAGDYVVLRRPAFMSEPVPGDVLEFRFPRDRRFTYLQRVLATGGQLVALKPGKPPVVDDIEAAWNNVTQDHWQSADCTLQRGTTAIEESPPKPSHAILVPTAHEGTAQDAVLSEGTLFMANDNRTYRGDSRKFGAIATSEVSGQVLAIGFSWDPCAGRARLERVGTRP